jgi:hypothetical protein
VAHASAVGGAHGVSGKGQGAGASGVEALFDHFGLPVSSLGKALLSAADTALGVILGLMNLIVELSALVLGVFDDLLSVGLPVEHGLVEFSTKLGQELLGLSAHLLEIGSGSDGSINSSLVVLVEGAIVLLSILAVEVSIGSKGVDIPQLLVPIKLLKSSVSYWVSLKLVE